MQTYLLAVILLGTRSILGQSSHVDPAFEARFPTNATVWTMAVQADGKILAGGKFESVQGVARSGLARLNVDGSLDASFDPGLGAAGDDSAVWAVAVQPDGKVLVGGVFTYWDERPRARIARLHPDGRLDEGFDPGGGCTGGPIRGPDYTSVYSILPQADGKVVLGGAFTFFDGVPRNRLARLNADGSLDGAFNPGSGAIRRGMIGPGDTGVYVMGGQGNTGQILVSGNFDTFAGGARSRLAKLDAAGRLDTAYVPPAELWPVYGLVVQADGKAIVAQESTNGLVRLNLDGSVDRNFDTGPNRIEFVYALASLPDGKLLAAGSSSFQAVLERRLPNGGPDRTLVSRMEGGFIGALAVDAEGRAYVGGSFASLDGYPSQSVARVLPNPAPFRMENPRVSGTEFRVDVPSMPGQIYSLDSKAALSDPNWMPAGSAVARGTRTTLTDANASVPQKFYRARPPLVQP